MDLTQVTADRPVFKQFECKAEPREKRIVRFTVTTSNPDRERDIVVTAGIDLTAFRRNAIITWAHDYRILPIGRAVAIEVGADRMVMDIEFASADLNPFADQVYRMVTAGFLQATSIGFRALEWVYDESRKGVNFLKSELLEVACVPIPANAEALIAMRAAGIDTAVLRSWAQRTLDDTAGDDIIQIDDDPDDDDRIVVSRRDLRDSIANEIRRQVAPIARQLQQRRQPSEPTIAITPEEARDVIGRAVRQELGAVVAREVKRAIDLLKGRVPDDIAGPTLYRR